MVVKAREVGLVSYSKDLLPYISTLCAVYENVYPAEADTKIKDLKTKINEYLTDGDKKPRCHSNEAIKDQLR